MQSFIEQLIVSMENNKKIIIPCKNVIKTELSISKNFLSQAKTILDFYRFDLTD